MRRKAFIRVNDVCIYTWMYVCIYIYMCVTFVYIHTYITLHYITLHYITLHYIHTYIYTNTST